MSFELRIGVTFAGGQRPAGTRQEQGKAGC
jgi:hypothetical protein